MSDLRYDALEAERDALRASLSAMTARVVEAVGYLKEGKRQFASTTTNSLVDTFIARIDAALKSAGEVK